MVAAKGCTSGLSAAQRALVEPHGPPARSGAFPPPRGPWDPRCSADGSFACGSDGAWPGGTFDAGAGKASGFAPAAPSTPWPAPRRAGAPHQHPQLVDIVPARDSTLPAAPSSRFSRSYPGARGCVAPQDASRELERWMPVCDVASWRRRPPTSAPSRSISRGLQQGRESPAGRSGDCTTRSSRSSAGGRR